ncbi:MAG TPA: hypothetical protein VIF62_39455 [Labilithrix sp.]|jgi:hypothetical protein
MARRLHVVSMACSLSLLAPASALAAEGAAAPKQAPSQSESVIVLTAEAGGGQTKASPDTPQSSYFYQRAAARWSPSERFDLSASLRATEDLARPPDTASTFATSGDAVFFGAIDGTYDLTPHWNLTVGFNGSPSSTRDVAAPSPLVTNPQPGQEPDALVRAETWSAGVLAEAGYDSFDADHAHDVDVAIDASAGMTGYFTDQHAIAPNSAVAKLPEQKASLAQTRVGGTTTFTFADDTDVAVDAAYYFYNSANPADVGTFVTGLQSAWGAGLPMLPPRWTLRPEVTQRFGRLSLRAYYQYADLALDDARGHTVGGKVQLAVGNVKLFVTGSYRTDLFAADETAQTWSAGAGLAWRL